MALQPFPGIDRDGYRDPTGLRFAALTTAERQALPTSELKAAYTVYDIDLKYLLTWDGSQWLDPFGNTATASRHTAEGGYAITMVNKTGASSMKGALVTAGGGVDFGAVLVPADVPNCVGMIYTPGVPNNGTMLVVIMGIAEVLFQDGMAPNVGWWVASAQAVAGRAMTAALPPGPDLPSQIDQHNAEIGHCLETKAAGTDVIARCVLHFN